LRSAGNAAGSRDIGRLLGARDVVNGSVRHHAGRVRVKVELVDVETEAVLMAEQFDRVADDPMRLHDEIVLAIAAILAPEIEKQELERAARRPRADASAYELVRRGLWHRQRATREDEAIAERLFMRALEVEPGHAGALSALSISRNFAAIRRWVDDVPAAFRQSFDFAHQAMAADPRDPQSRFALGLAHMNLGHRDAAVAELREAIRLNPSLVAARANPGQMFNYLDRPEEALPELGLALRLSPHDPYRYQWLPHVAASHKHAASQIGARSKTKTKGRSSDQSRSAIAFRKGAALRRAGKTFEEMCEELRADPDTADWCCEKGDAEGSRELHRIWGTSRRND
jgi:tetratricopeptide (TPR) repeat protein